MTLKTAVRLRIKGRVQGVGFRYFTAQTAKAAGVVGWVRNTSEGHVESEAEGERSQLEQWLANLRKGPPLSQVADIDVEWIDADKDYKEFEIYA